MPASRTCRAARWPPPRTTTSFDDFWTPFTFAVGPPGQHLLKRSPEQQDAIRDECRRLLGEPDGPFDLAARAWYARGVVPG